MAEYDRRILVPYLQDVCSMEMLCARLIRECNDCEQRVNNWKDMINRQIIDPKRPYYEEFEPEPDMGFNLLCIGCVVVGFGLLQWSILLAAIPLGYAAIGIIPAFFENRAMEKDAQKKYEAALKRYEEIIAENETERKRIPQYQRNLQIEQNNLSVLLKRLENAWRLRLDIYNVNVIPSKYRNIHVAYYLYDYFSSCRESDLDKVIQTMLLDEIIQRLDQIILQNEQILLNQRIQIALQEEQNRTIADNQRKELNAIARMERNQELQLDYQHMIAKNQLVTNFLLAADYLYK